jgi:hypothetical protein
MSAANERTNNLERHRPAIIDLIRNGRRLGPDPVDLLSPVLVELPLSDCAIASRFPGREVTPSMVAQVRAELEVAAKQAS